MIMQSVKHRCRQIKISIQLEKKINIDLKMITKIELKCMKIYLITRECEGINFSWYFFLSLDFNHFRFSLLLFFLSFQTIGFDREHEASCPPFFAHCKIERRDRLHLAFYKYITLSILFFKFFSILLTCIEL